MSPSTLLNYRAGHSFCEQDSASKYTLFSHKELPTVSYHNTNMPSFTVFASLITVALAGVLPRQQIDATGVSRTGAVTYYNTGGGFGACGTTLSDGALTCAVSTTLYDACMSLPLSISCLHVVSQPFSPDHPALSFVYMLSLQIWLTFCNQDTQNGNPNDNSLCGKKIQVSIGGQSTTVTIADRCAGCAEWDLDLTPTAFNAIVAGGEAVGRTTANWQFMS